MSESPADSSAAEDATRDASMTDATDATDATDETDATDATSSVVTSSDAGDASLLPPYVQLVLASDPIAYWRFEEIDGSTASSEVGDAAMLDGIYTLNTLQGVPGALGPNGGFAFRSFDAGGTPSGTCGVRMGDIMPFLGDGPYTIEFWVRPIQNADSNYRQIFGREFGRSTAYSLLFQSNESPSGFRFYQADDAGNPQYANPNRAVSALAWTHVVISFDGAMLTFYENGAIGAARNMGFTDSVSEWVTPAVAPDAGAAFFTVGSDFRGALVFLGDIDEFAVYAKAFDQGTVLAHYQAGANAQDDGASSDAGGDR